VIVAYIDGSEIPVFVNEEVHNVYCVENGRDQDRFGDISMDLILISNEREVTGAELVHFFTNAKSTLSAENLEIV
jgi:hypothetical protein